MSWPNEVVEKVGRAIHTSMMTARIWVSVNGESWESSKPEAQAALSSITLQDIVKLPEVKALVEAGSLLRHYGREQHYSVFDARGAWDAAIDKLKEASNG